MVDHPVFPSGDWTGYYLQEGRRRHDMFLSFRDGRLSGAGQDTVGLFCVRGAYDADTREVWWNKTYPGSHDVFYRGWREPRGIVGNWEIEDTFTGGFRIWPLGEGEGETREAIEQLEEPVETLAPGTAPVSDPGSDRG